MWATTVVALNLARLCPKVVEYGAGADPALEENAAGPAADKVIEGNILLSRLGYGSCGWLSPTE